MVRECFMVKKACQRGLRGFNGRGSQRGLRYSSSTGVYRRGQEDAVSMNSCESSSRSCACALTHLAPAVADLPTRMDEKERRSDLTRSVFILISRIWPLRTLHATYLSRPPTPATCPWLAPQVEAKLLREHRESSSSAYRAEDLASARAYRPVYQKRVTSDSSARTQVSL